MFKWIILTVFLLIVLGYMGFDIRKAIEAPASQTNLEYAKSAVVHVWDKYLSKPAKYLWNEVFIKYVWNPIKNRLDKNLEEEEKVELDDGMANEDKKDEVSVNKRRFFYT